MSRARNWSAPPNVSLRRVVVALSLCALPALAHPGSLDEDIDCYLAGAGPASGAFVASEGITREVGLRKEKDWYIGLTPYVWFTGFSVETGGETVAAEFGDVAALANSGVTVIGTFEWKRWTFGADYTYADLSDNSQVESITSSLSFRQHILHLAAGYAILDHGSEKNPTGVRLAIQIGARYWDTSGSFKVTFPPLLPGGPERVVEVDTGQSWWDLTTGFTARWPLNPKVDFRLWGNVGGFGIGNSSDYTWEAGFVTSFLVTRYFGFHVGYRILQYSRESGGTDTELTMQGPIVGFTFVF